MITWTPLKYQRTVRVHHSGADWHFLISHSGWSLVKNSTYANTKYCGHGAIYRQWVQVGRTLLSINLMAYQLIMSS